MLWEGRRKYRTNRPRVRASLGNPHSPFMIPGRAFGGSTKEKVPLIRPWGWGWGRRPWIVLPWGLPAPPVLVGLAAGGPVAGGRRAGARRAGGAPAPAGSGRAGCVGTGGGGDAASARDEPAGSVGGRWVYRACDPCGPLMPRGLTGGRVVGATRWARYQPSALLVAAPPP